MRGAVVSGVLGAVGVVMHGDIDGPKLGLFFTGNTIEAHMQHTSCRQLIYSTYHGYNDSYLMLTNFIGSSYMSDFYAKMLWVVVLLAYLF